MRTHHGSMGWTLATNSVKRHQCNPELDMSLTVDVTSTSSRWVNVGRRQRVDSRTRLTGERVHLPHFRIS